MEDMKGHVGQGYKYEINVINTTFKFIGRQIIMEDRRGLYWTKLIKKNYQGL